MRHDQAKRTGTWFAFELAGRHYAVPSTDVREVIDPVVPTPVPGAPADVVGIINLRGTIVTVLDGCRRLGLDLDHDAPRDGANARLMIFDAMDEAVAMRIDALDDALQLRSDDPPPPSVSATRTHDPVRGTLQRDGCRITLLDTRTLCRVHTSPMEVQA